MIFSSSKLFSNVLNRLRGSKAQPAKERTEQKKSRAANPDGLYPLRQALLNKAKETGEKTVDLKSKLRKSTSRKVPRKILVRDDQVQNMHLDIRKPSSVGGGKLLTPKTPADLTPKIKPNTAEMTPSMETYFDKTLTNKSASLLPEWYRIGFRRSTTVNDTHSDDFSENLKDFVLENDDIEDNMFMKNASDFGGGALTPTPSKTFHLSRRHVLSIAQMNCWNHLSLSRSREFSKRKRGKSAALMQREAAFSCSLAMASFQSALRRSTLAPIVTDEMFAAEVSDFIEEHAKLQENAWKVIEKLTPTVQGMVCSL